MSRFPYLRFFTPNPPTPPTSLNLNWLHKSDPQQLGAKSPNER